MTGPLTAVEIAALRSGGVDPFEEPTEFVDADAELAEILARALGVSEAAERLGIGPGEVERRIAGRELHGVPTEGGRRLPAFQFAGGAAVPGLAQVLAAVPADLHPVALVRWFISPDVDLVVGQDETQVSPRD